MRTGTLNGISDLSMLRKQIVKGAVSTPTSILSRAMMTKPQLSQLSYALQSVIRHPRSTFPVSCFYLHAAGYIIGV
jgi:hypothetical protein